MEKINTIEHPQVSEYLAVADRIKSLRMYIKQQMKMMEKASALLRMNILNG